jgi:hypothetical protein
MRRAFYLKLVSEDIFTSFIGVLWSISLLIVLNSDYSAVILCHSFVEDAMLASSKTLFLIYFYDKSIH